VWWEVQATAIGFLEQARGLNREQKSAFVASFLGWTMDAFDYFLIVFVFAEIADDLNTSLIKVQFATTLTLAARPVGALVFGLLADRYGRRVPLMVDVAFYSVVEFLTGFSTSITMLLVLRTLYGIGMGGEWGIGASLAMEKIPTEKRGFYSGLLQQGYPFGYLLAAMAYFLIGQTLGWRWLFFLGSLPALLVLFIRSKVGESEAWKEARSRQTTIRQVFLNRAVLQRFAFLILLMTLFNFMSHGTQDQYLTFLKEQHHASSNMAVLIAVIYNIGALIGGVTIGALSESIGRRKAVLWTTLLALPVVPLFAFSPTLGLLALGAFLMQFLVQGAWGIIPAHLSELSPDEIRGFYPGVTYQLGNLLAAINLPLQTRLANHFDKNFGLGMAIVIVPVLLLTALVTWLGPENRGAVLGKVTGPEQRERSTVPGPIRGVPSPES
jgi:MFS transporter, SHS family, lactate transporter